MSKWSHDCARDDQIVPEECLACQYERADRERDDLAANLLKSNTRNYDLGRERDDALRRLAVLQRGFEAMQGLIDSGAQANAAAMQSLHDEMVGYKCERDDAKKDSEAWNDLANRRTEERDKFSAEAAQVLDRLRALEPANETLGQLYQKTEQERIQLLQTARRLVEGLERALDQCEIDEIPGPCWDPYEDARKLLGCPVQNFPGGFEGSHFHFSTFKVGEDTCDTCDDYAESHKIEEKKENA
jgi:hypothetical protein